MISIHLIGDFISEFGENFLKSDSEIAFYVKSLLDVSHTMDDRGMRLFEEFCDFREALRRELPGNVH